MGAEQSYPDPTEHLRPDPAEQIWIIDNITHGREAEINGVLDKLGLFTRNKDLLQDETKDLIVKRGRAEILGKVLGVLAGEIKNDQVSESPGLTLIISVEAHRRAEEGSFFVTGVESKQVNDSMYLVRIPNGVYVMGMGGAQFYQTATDNWRESPHHDPFTLPYSEVALVVGYDGKTWANRDLKWEKFNY